MELCVATHASAMDYTKLSLRQLKIMREAFLAVMKRAKEAEK